MELKQVLHMKEGTGKDSYANNSKYQESVIEEVKTILKESVQQLYQFKLSECLVLADLGCSSGPNAHKVLLEIIDAVDWTCQNLNRQLPEFQVFLNDLPGNDFNTLFKSFPSLWEKLGQIKGSDFVASCFINGTPGSFHKRLFPSNFLHFAQSSYSLQWLSQGLIEEEKADAFNIPMYLPSAQEVKKLIEIEGSFTLRRLHTFNMKWDLKILADGVRAGIEPLLASSAFEGAIIDDLFRRFEEIATNYHVHNGEVKLHNLVVSVSRNN
ncbi:hypothetical protein Ancab_039844 [Ancistrocladus abbreviatus]